MLRSSPEIYEHLKLKQLSTINYQLGGAAVGSTASAEGFFIRHGRAVFVGGVLYLLNSESLSKKRKELAGNE
jgi:hypothetical protein